MDKYEKNGSIYHDYEKVKVIVFSTSKELHMYYKLFKLMCKASIVDTKETKNSCTIETDKLKINFYVKPKNNHAIGYSAHYVINLTQDEEFDNEIARPLTCIRNFLDKEKFELE